MYWCLTRVWRWDRFWGIYARIPEEKHTWSCLFRHCTLDELESVPLSKLVSYCAYGLYLVTIIANGMSGAIT
jgi:hypothetical protein